MQALPFETVAQPLRPPAGRAPAAPHTFSLDAWGRQALALLRAPRSMRAAALLLGVWTTLAGNVAMWRTGVQLGHEGALGAHPALLAAGVALLVMCVNTLLFLLGAWPRVFKPVALLLLVVTACVQHFMLAYGVVMDQSMLRNALQTNFTEARDLFDPALLLQLVLVAGLPALWLVPLRLRREGALGRTLRNIGLAVLLAAAATASTTAMYRTLAPLVRNHMQLRFVANPFSAIGSALSVARRGLRTAAGGTRLVPITAGAALGPSYAAGAAPAARPPLFVLVVGETARADHFGLNGYGRDTTPQLARRGVVSFTDVRSCGTNTLHSVPCMFSSLGKAGWEGRRAEHENLLDVLQAAGLGVLWLDNQAGCKGVCDRVAAASTGQPFAPAADAAAALCEGGECLDRVMLAGLDERIAALPPERRARGVVLVMHMMGSHGPAYYRRSAPQDKRFAPECATTALADCSHEALVNAYDNSIAETDRFLAETIDWLKDHSARYDPALLYLSDHGESLGEFGLYLHGVPYTFAPDVQKHVPMVLWLPDAFARRTATAAGCVAGERKRPLSHDNLYSTVLGLVDVRSPTYRAGLDAFSRCRTPI